VRGSVEVLGIGGALMNFTADWFGPNVEHWRKHVIPRLQQHPIRFLEVGSFEGRSAAWLLQNVLTAPNDRITCVDVWEPNEAPFLFGYEETFDANMREVGAGPRLVKRKGSSREVLRTLPLGSFDAAYIDGSHLTHDVLHDALACYDLVRVGGLLIFDDYRYAPDPDHVVHEAVDFFLSVYDQQLRVLFADWQLIAERTG
jgi:predicted O-methyltransferase YrrM